MAKKGKYFVDGFGDFINHMPDNSMVFPLLPIGDLSFAHINIDRCFFQKGN